MKVKNIKILKYFYVLKLLKATKLTLESELELN